MKNNLLICAGLLLIAAALSLIIQDQMNGERAARASEQALQKLEAHPPSAFQEPQTKEAPIPASIPDPDIGMPTLEVNGEFYIGILEIPALERKFPIISKWSDAGLDAAPCRYTGSAYLNDLIIAGHNYKKCFGSLSRLAIGDNVIFTDVEGNRFDYLVSSIEQLPGAAVDEMTAGDWDLTLFTCTISGKARLTIRCILAG